MKKKDKKVSLFDMQNLLLMADYLEDRNKLSDKKTEEKITKTIESKEKNKSKTGSATLVLIGLTR